MSIGRAKFVSVRKKVSVCIGKIMRSFVTTKKHEVSVCIDQMCIGQSRQKVRYISVFILDTE